MSEPVVRELSCGMPLVCERIDGVQSAGLTWLVAGGSARDPEELEGLSTMWSEILFRGAGDLDSRGHADALDTLGASRSSNVQTHHLKLGASAMGPRLEEALPLIVDMVRRPRMEAESVEPVRDLCMQELLALKDEPQQRVMLNLRRRHNPSPLNRSGVGTERGLSAIAREDLVERWPETARPRGSIFAAAGDVDIDRLEAALNTLLDGWEGDAPSVETGDAPARGYEHETDQTNQVHIGVSYDSPAERDERSALERLATAALSGGMSGRLFTEVREKRGLVYAVQASYRSDRDYGRTVAYAGTTPERAQETVDVLLGELRRINGPASAGGGIDQSEFDRAKVGLKSNLVMSGESTSARAGALASDLHRLDRPRSLEERVAEIDRITLDQVNDYLSTRELGEITVTTIGPAALRVEGMEAAV